VELQQMSISQMEATEQTAPRCAKRVQFSPLPQIYSDRSSASGHSSARARSTEQNSRNIFVLLLACTFALCCVVALLLVALAIKNAAVMAVSQLLSKGEVAVAEKLLSPI
jgi:type VI protein secretion system component VasF